MPRQKNDSGNLLFFRVYPEHKRLHYDVFIWETAKAMREAIKGVFKREELKTIMACVLTLQTEYQRQKGHIGDIHFNKEFLGRDIIAHESTHAAIGWAPRAKVELEDIYDRPDPKRANPVEERFCDVVGAIVEQIEEAIRHADWRIEESIDESRVIYVDEPVEQ